MYETRNKAKMLRDFNAYLSAKTLGMFRYNGLPDTIPALELERILQGCGFAFISEVDGDLYALRAGLGGEPDAYQQPTKVTLSNPALGLSETRNIATDGVIMKNDSMAVGLMPLFDRYHTLMVENSINMELTAFNSRAITTISASDNKTLESAERYLQKLGDGEISVIGDNAMFEGVKKQGGNAAGQDSVKDLIEYNQFLKSALYSEVGINTPFNMKRERVNSDEVGQHEDSLTIFINDMKVRRVEALEKINEKYGTEISVTFSMAWEKYNEPQSEVDSGSGGAGDSKGIEPEETLEPELESMPDADELEPHRLEGEDLNED